MRRFGVAVILLAAAQTAQAADFPDLTDLPILRGGIRDGLSRTNTDWSGFYVGGQYGVSSNNFQTLGAPQRLQALAGSMTPPGTTNFATYQVNDQTGSQGWGGFVGYNAQWTDAVLGIDVNYNFGGQKVSRVINPTSAVQTVGVDDYVTVTSGNQTMKITDYGSARLRAGWAVSGFLPYATVGFAMGRADMASVVNVNGTVDPGGGGNPVPYNNQGVQNKSGALLYGYSYGGGLDVSLFAGLFLRAEVEVARFTTNWGMDATVTSARAGAGFKF